MKNKLLKIAGELTIKDWKDLVGEQNNLKINYKDNEKWGLAFHFFEERIRTRYLNPINTILNLKLNEGEGFAVVNLQCSLIETIESFINGWVYFNDGKIKPNGWFDKTIKNYNSKVNSQYIFENFFKNHVPFNVINGTSFYFSVRCALLHETQTKNNWKIRKGVEGGDFFKELNGEKIIFRGNFQKELKNLIERYKIAIISKQDFDGIDSLDLRENFIAKFNHICDNS